MIGCQNRRPRLALQLFSCPALTEPITMGAADVRLVSGADRLGTSPRPQPPRTIRGERLAEPLATPSARVASALKDAWFVTAPHLPVTRLCSACNSGRQLCFSAESSLTSQTPAIDAPRRAIREPRIVPTSRMALHGRCNAVPQRRIFHCEVSESASAFRLAFVN